MWSGDISPAAAARTEEALMRRAARHCRSAGDEQTASELEARAAGAAAEARRWEPLTDSFPGLPTLPTDPTFPFGPNPWDRTLRGPRRFLSIHPGFSQGPAVEPGSGMEGFPSLQIAERGWGSPEAAPSPFLTEPAGPEGGR